jgi:hypothetical protein
VVHLIRLIIFCQEVWLFAVKSFNFMRLLFVYLVVTTCMLQIGHSLLFLHDSKQFFLDSPVAAAAANEGSVTSRHSNLLFFFFFFFFLNRSRIPRINVESVTQLHSYLDIHTFSPVHSHRRCLELSSLEAPKHCENVHFFLLIFSSSVQLLATGNSACDNEETCSSTESVILRLFARS